MNIAFSYLRFSTPEQAVVDSRRRQLALAEEYAVEHNLKPDHRLSFRDLGISAFRGENAKAVHFVHSWKPLNMILCHAVARS